MEKIKNPYNNLIIMRVLPMEDVDRMQKAAVNSGLCFARLGSEGDEYYPPGVNQGGIKIPEGHELVVVMRKPPLFFGLANVELVAGENGTQLNVRW